MRVTGLSAPLAEALCPSIISRRRPCLGDIPEDDGDGCCGCCGDDGDCCDGCCDSDCCGGDNGKNTLHNLPHNVRLLFSAVVALLDACFSVLGDPLGERGLAAVVPEVVSVFAGTGTGAGTTSGGKGCPAKSKKGFALPRGDGRDL